MCRRDSLFNKLVVGALRTVAIALVKNVKKARTTVSVELLQKAALLGPGNSTNIQNGTRYRIDKGSRRLLRLPGYET